MYNKGDDYCSNDEVSIFSFVILPTNSLPYEKRIEGKYNMRMTPPVVYVNFLRCLCHYHFYNTEQFWDSLRCLQFTIENNYFIANVFEKASSYNMLGILFKLLGDTDQRDRHFCDCYKCYNKMQSQRHFFFVSDCKIISHTLFGFF